MLDIAQKEQLTTDLVAKMDSASDYIKQANASITKLIAVLDDCVNIGMPDTSNLADPAFKANVVLVRDELMAESKYLDDQAKEIAFTLPISVNSAYYPPTMNKVPGIGKTKATAVHDTSTKATATSGVIVFTASVSGTAGNGIALIFDGILTVTAVTSAWNTAHPTNTVTFTGDGATVILASTVTLSGGLGGGPINFIANTPGEIGNSISLVFDGIKTLSAVASAWNTANVDNTVAYSGDGATIVPAATVTLSGALDGSVPPVAFSAPSVIASLAAPAGEPAGDSGTFSASAASAAKVAPPKSEPPISPPPKPVPQAAPASVPPKAAAPAPKPAAPAPKSEPPKPPAPKEEIKK